MKLGQKAPRRPRTGPRPAAVRRRRRGRAVRPRQARRAARARRRPARRGRSPASVATLQSAPGRRADAGAERRRRRRPPLGPRRPPDRRPPRRARSATRAATSTPTSTAPRPSCWPAGRPRRTRRLLEDVGRSYPVARVVPDPGSRWASSTTSLSGPATRLGRTSGSSRRARPTRPGHGPCWGLARAYEAQKLWVSARDAYIQAQKRFGESGSTSPAGCSRSGRWSPSGSPARRSTGCRATGPSRAFPSRSGDAGTVRWTEAARPLAAEGVPPRPRPPGSSSPWAREIRPVDPATGQSAWSRRPRRRAGLGRLPRRPDHRRDPHEARRAEPGQGGRRVAIRPRGRRRGAGRGQPVRPEPAARRPATPPRPAPRLPDRRQPGLLPPGRPDPDGLRRRSGQLDWSFTPTAGPDQPAPARSGPRRIVLQVRKPNAALVLETATGRRRADSPGRGGGMAPRPARRSTTTTSPWWSTGPRWRTSTRPRGQCLALPGDQGLAEPGPAPPLRRRRAAAGPPRRPRSDPARPGHRGQGVGRWHARAEDLGDRPEAIALARRPRLRRQRTGDLWPSPSPTARPSGQHL